MRYKCKDEEIALGFLDLIDDISVERRVNILKDFIKVAKNEALLEAAKMVFDLPVGMRERVYGDIERSLMKRDLEFSVDIDCDLYLEALDIVELLPEKRRSRVIERMADTYHYSSLCNPDRFKEIKEIFLAISEENKTVGAVVKIAEDVESCAINLREIDKTHDERFIGALGKIIKEIVIHNKMDKKEMLEIVYRLPLKMKVHILKSATWGYISAGGRLDITREMPLNDRLKILPHFIEESHYDKNMKNDILEELCRIAPEKRTKIVKLLISKKHLLDMDNEGIFFILKMINELEPEVRDVVFNELKCSLFEIYEHNAKSYSFECSEFSFWGVVKELPEQIQTEIHRYVDKYKKTFLEITSTNSKANINQEINNTRLDMRNKDANRARFGA